MYLVVVPAYGRDYKTKAAVLADWEAGKDFENATVGVRGRYVNKAGLPPAWGVEIRYANQAKTLVIEPAKP